MKRGKGSTTNRIMPLVFRKGMDRRVEKGIEKEEIPFARLALVPRARGEMILDLWRKCDIMKCT